MIRNDRKVEVKDQKDKLNPLKKDLADMSADYQLAASMAVSTTLQPGVYHAKALSTTTGITITFDGGRRRQPLAYQ